MNEQQELTVNNTAFSANLALLRRTQGLSQEQLAERLGVSRQSVSKWESGVCLPELVTLDTLCTMFGCTLDTLLRGSVAQEDAGALDAYDAEGDAFSLAITAGVTAILLGVTLSIFGQAAALPENLSGFLVLLGVIIGVVIFIASGIRHDDFCKAHPAADVTYPPQRRAPFDARFPWLMAGSVGVILADVAMMALLHPLFALWLGESTGSTLLAGVFMLLLTAAVSVLVWGGMQKGKYDDPDEKRRLRDDPAYAQGEKRMERAQGVLWITVVMVYLMWSFLLDAWKISWVVFIAGGLLSAIVGILLGREED
ncbi:MAG: helix-turn-helix domain-containing protein [Gemmiger sp.]